MTAETPSLMVQCCRCESCMAGTRPAEAHDEAHVFPSRQQRARLLRHERERKKRAVRQSYMELLQHTRRSKQASLAHVALVFGKPRVASCSSDDQIAAAPAKHRPPPPAPQRHTPLKLARRIAGGPLAPSRQPPGWSAGAKAWDRRPWASTAAPPQPLFGIHAARALSLDLRGQPWASGWASVRSGGWPCRLLRGYFDHAGMRPRRSWVCEDAQG